MLPFSQTSISHGHLWQIQFNSIQCTLKSTLSRLTNIFMIKNLERMIIDISLRKMEIHRSPSVPCRCQYDLLPPLWVTVFLQKPHLLSKLLDKTPIVPKNLGEKFELQNLSIKSHQFEILCIIFYMLYL